MKAALLTGIRKSEVKQMPEPEVCRDTDVLVKSFMKAIAINGSPRKGGNTEILLKQALAPLAAAGWETEFIQLGGTDIRGCQPVIRALKRKTPNAARRMTFLTRASRKWSPLTRFSWDRRHTLPT